MPPPPGRAQAAGSRADRRTYRWSRMRAAGGTHLADRSAELVALSTGALQHSRRFTTRQLGLTGQYPTRANTSHRPRGHSSIPHTGQGVTAQHPTLANTPHRSIPNTGQGVTAQYPTWANTPHWPIPHTSQYPTRAQSVGVLITSWRHLPVQSAGVLITSWRHLPVQSAGVLITSWRHLLVQSAGVLITSWRHLPVQSAGVLSQTTGPAGSSLLTMQLSSQTPRGGSE